MKSHAAVVILNAVYSCGQKSLFKPLVYIGCFSAILKGPNSRLWSTFKIPYFTGHKV